MMELISLDISVIRNLKIIKIQCNFFLFKIKDLFIWQNEREGERKKNFTGV